MEALFYLLNNIGGIFRPERYARFEPLRYHFNAGKLDEFIETTAGGLLSRGPKPFKASLDLMVSPDWFSSLLGGVPVDYFKDQQRTEDYLHILKAIYHWGQMTYGYVCHSQDYDLKNYMPEKNLYHGVHIQESLPGIFWANFFGPTYVEFFGRQRFLSAPAFHQEELDDGGFLLMTAASPLDYLQPKVKKLEQALRRHLGEDAFFDRSKPLRTCRAPEFRFPEPSEPALKPLPISTIFPDPTSFIAEAPHLAQALAARLRLDFTPKSLRKLDTAMLKQHGAPEDNEENLAVAREATAYYGEILCRQLRGQWALSQDSTLPIVLIPTGEEPMTEIPYIRSSRRL